MLKWITFAEITLNWSWKIESIDILQDLKVNYAAKHNWNFHCITMGNGMGNAEITLNKVSNRNHGVSTFCVFSTNLSYHNRSLITKIHFNHLRPIVMRLKERKENLCTDWRTKVMWFVSVMIGHRLAVVVVYIDRLFLFCLKIIIIYYYYYYYYYFLLFVGGGGV